jgi:hypothetical protein
MLLTLHRHQEMAEAHQKRVFPRLTGPRRGRL